MDRWSGKWVAHGLLLTQLGGLNWPDDVTAEKIIALLTTNDYVPDKCLDFKDFRGGDQE